MQCKQPLKCAINSMEKPPLKPPLSESSGSTHSTLTVLLCYLSKTAPGVWGDVFHCWGNVLKEENGEQMLVVWQREVCWLCFIPTGAQLPGLSLSDDIVGLPSLDAPNRNACTLAAREKSPCASRWL